MHISINFPNRSKKTIGSRFSGVSEKIEAFPNIEKASIL